MTEESSAMLEEKWKKLLRAARLFQFVPFINFVFVSGSMATGVAKESSDFDVIVGARYGRIFTVRFFAVVLFGVFGLRRKRFDHKDEARDKICLSHFVTEKSYRLSPPHGPYWAMLYRALVPVVGSSQKMQQFWDANEDWMGERKMYVEDPRHRYKKKLVGTNMLEYLFGGIMGDVLEGFLRRFQIRRIERGNSWQSEGVGYKPRIIYSDVELEFHPDTRRIEALDRVL